MANFEEVNCDVGVVDMFKHVRPDTNLDVYLASLPELSKPLETIYPPDFKASETPTQVYTLDSDDEIPQELENMLTQHEGNSTGKESVQKESEVQV